MMDFSTSSSAVREGRLHLCHVVSDKVGCWAALRLFISRFHLLLRLMVCLALQEYFESYTTLQSVYNSHAGWREEREEGRYGFELKFKVSIIF